MSNKNNKKKPWFKNVKKTVNNDIKEIYNFEVTPCYGYYGFQLYFTEKGPLNNEKIIKNTQSFESYIHRNLNLFPTAKIKQSLAINVDLKRLLNDSEFTSEWEKFKEEIHDDTETCLNCMSLAVHQFLIKEEETKIKDDNLLVFNHLQTVRCRLCNIEPILQLKQLRVNYYGKLISLRGTVIKVGGVCLTSQYLAFRCSTCQGSQVVKQVDCSYTLPMKCLSKGCRAGKNFIPLQSSPHTRTVNSQMIKLQELVGEESDDNGRVPRTIECDLTEDLVNSCIPGDDITITGVVKVRSSGENSSKSKQPSVFLLYLDVVSVFNEKNASGKRKAGIKFNKQDYYAIDKIHSEPNLFRFLVHSLCPNIYGHEIVKAGLLLASFGGTINDDNIRSDSHVLVVGDPGLGKSQMLKACVNVAPRGVYVCGNSSSLSGLTVSMTKEAGGDWALEAGALVLADQGVCCIDEFDKMGNKHSCLLEAMEQQSISIAKAGITCYLPARMSVIAAANPSGGHYNKAKTVAENLKINSPLLSRFDLVFILLDKPDEQIDKLLSEHILAMSSGKKFSMSSSETSSLVNESQCADDLKLRLRLQEGEEIDRLPHVLFRKFIAYAKKYVHPKLNRDAQKILKEFYMGMRRNYKSGDSTPLTTRQLESMIRLTQARAKCELREEATAEDARDVIQIMRASLIDVFSDDHGILNFTRSQNGSGISNRSKVTKLLKLMERKAEALGRSLFSMAEIKGCAEQMGIPKSDMNSTIDSLNLKGYILKKGGDKFQLTIVE